MISVYFTDEGWFLRQGEEEIGYYSSLPDLLYVAYPQKRKTACHGRVEQRNPDGNDR